MRSASLLLIGLLTLAASAGRPDEPAKNAPAIEQQPTDPKAAKIVLIAGSNFFKAGEHEYLGGCAVLAELLRQTPGVAPVVALDWPKKDDTFTNAKAVVFFFDGGAKHGVLQGDRAAKLQKMADAGVGIVQFHQAVDYPKDFGDRARGWAGGAWEAKVGERAHWVEEFKTFPDHPICRGVAPFKIDDGWLWKIKFADGMKGVTPLLRTWNPKATTKPEGAQDVIAWAFERPGGGRSFNFTGGHLHASLAQDGYRRFLVNGVLWSAGVEVPKVGARVDLDPKTLPDYLKPAPPKK